MAKCGFKHERALYAQGCGTVVGIDEAGRGPLAGPVVAAAVVLPRKFRHRTLRDSKQLTARQRERIYEELTSGAAVFWAASVVSCEEVDALNILRASHAAMRRALAALGVAPDHALIDGRRVEPFPIAQTAIICGDGCSFSIAAASVIAKVTRDRAMAEYDALFPEYAFAKHKGYGTPLHLKLLTKHGPCPIHRRSFLPVRLAVSTAA